MANKEKFLLLRKIKRFFLSLKKRIVMKHRAKKIHTKYMKGIYIGRNVVNKGATLVLYENSSIGDNVIFWGSGTISIGKNSSIGDNSIVHSHINGGIYLGEEIIIGPGLNMIDSDHKYEEPTLIRHQGMNSKKIIIDDDVWVGSNVTILKGTILKKHSVVGACSLLNKEYPEKSVIVGIPGKVIKNI